MLKHLIGNNLRELEKEFNSLKNVKLVTVNISGMNFIIHYTETKNVKNMERRKLKSA